MLNTPANKTFLIQLIRFCFITLTVIRMNPPLALANSPLFKVVIDPGHGGADEGTVVTLGNSRITEKEVTLSLARQVSRYLKAKGYLVTLTRTYDQEIPLAHRTAIANRLGADVFISIHMNSTDNKNARLTQGTAQKTGQGRTQGPAQGVETYILNTATDASSRRLAHLENSVISSSTPESPEQKDVALILKDLRLDANLRESKLLACTIQERLVTATSKQTKSLHPSTFLKRDRGVKQALFHVLLGADMPSVLVEAGFLNNREDRDFILSPRGQLLIGQSIANAIHEYRHEKQSKKNSITLNKCKVN